VVWKSKELKKPSGAKRELSLLLFLSSVWEAISRASGSLLNAIQAAGVAWMNEDHCRHMRGLGGAADTGQRRQ
jgi:hypothetical protein